MKVAFQKGTRLGMGGFSAVYQATELATGRAVALKQSRVSLRVKRSHLQHEARVLKLLAGHPTIPQVYGYGRIQHFELLSMQLLGKTLRDVTDESGPLPVQIVIKIADQLLSALQHISNKHLVHRDIKPYNILLLNPSSWNVYLIDFGFAYPASEDVPEVEYATDPSKANTVLGTLGYASLNAHDGRKLTYRDDLEPLAYTLIYLLRASLPWSYYIKHGTIYGQIRQVQAQKRFLDGSRLAVGLPDEFGELVDYARSLSPKEIPLYQEWRKRISQATPVADTINACETGSTVSTPEDTRAPNPRLPSPVQPGQIVLVKLASSITAEGYSIQAGHEDSYIPDPRFGMPEWDSQLRPCVVLRVNWRAWANAYQFIAVPISRNCDELENSNSLKVPIVGSESSLSSSAHTISPEPEWPLKNTYCYAFKRPASFYCLRSQETVPSFWTVNSAGIDILLSALTSPRNPNSFSVFYDSISPEPDTRNDAKLRGIHVRLYAQISSLSPSQLASGYYDMCNGDLWMQVQNNDAAEGILPNSYRRSDFEEWEHLQERDRSLTLEPALEGGDIPLANVLKWLDEIELVA